MKIGIAVVACVLVLCAVIGGIWFTSSMPTAQAEARVKAKLIDPESARFEDVTIRRETASACGRVNSKNRMGGYVGMRHFVLLPSGEVIFSSSEADVGTGSNAEIALRIENLEKFTALIAKNC